MLNSIKVMYTPASNLEMYIKDEKSVRLGFTLASRFFSFPCLYGGVPLASVGCFGCGGFAGLVLGVSISQMVVAVV